MRIATPLVLVIGCLTGPERLSADPAPNGPRGSASSAERPAGVLSAESIERRLNQVKNAANLDEPVRKSLVETY